ncbi:MAG: HNH endonuclease signature motif containing protein [Dehalococcoidia bacterium]
MNYRLGGQYSVVLMSRRPNAPYRDQVEDEGRTIVYEGHDLPRSASVPDPKTVDQPLEINGRRTQNGLFFDAIRLSKSGQAPSEVVRVLREAAHRSVGLQRRVPASGRLDRAVWAREVCKFRLELDSAAAVAATPRGDAEPTRVIPSQVKLAVWRRDGGRCVMCGSSDNLHFDHVIPFSRGGSSLVSENIQILCARHNLAKRDAIQ